MIDPKRFLEGDSTKFERELLGSMLNEAPSNAQQLKMMQALCIAGPVLWTTRAKAVVDSAQQSAKNWGNQVVQIVSTKAVVAVAVVGVAGVGLYSLNESSGKQVADVARSEVKEAPVVVPLNKTVLAPAPSRLGQEVALLDKVRTALRAGSVSEAQEALVQYHQQFPEGLLRQEAKLLQLRLP